jgi:hypothetical protein
LRKLEFCFLLSIVLCKQIQCMKSKLYILICILFVQQAYAQLPEDALRMSWNVPSGTARQQAIGGAMGSLGGEISALFTNPAGLGLYKTGEFVLTPGFAFSNGKGMFRGIIPFHIRD